MDVAAAAGDKWSSPIQKPRILRLHLLLLIISVIITTLLTSSFSMAVHDGATNADGADSANNSTTDGCYESGNCTTGTHSSNTNTVVIAVCVTVGVVIIVVVIIVVLNRTGKLAFPPTTFRGIECCSCEGDVTPEPIPAPEDLENSFTSKNKSNAQARQGASVIHRYTKEPGGTPPRVESVHYNEFQGSSVGPVYINSLVLSTPGERELEGEDGGVAEEIYENTEQGTTTTTRTPSKAEKQVSQTKKVAPKPPGKPKTSAKPTAAKPTTTSARTSIFPPGNNAEDSCTNDMDPDEEFYTNAPVVIRQRQQKQDDDDDYVNKDDILELHRMRK